MAKLERIFVIENGMYRSEYYDLVDFDWYSEGECEGCGEHAKLNQHEECETCYNTNPSVYTQDGTTRLRKLLL